MKKALSMFLGAVLIFCLNACGETAEQTTEQVTTTQATVATTTEESLFDYTVGDTIECWNYTLTLNSFDIVDKVTIHPSNSMDRYYAAESGYKLLCFSGKMKNKKSDTLDVYMDISRSGKVNGTMTLDFDDIEFMLEKSEFYKLEPTVEANVYIYCQVPEEIANNFSSIKLTFDQSYTISYNK